MHAADHFPSRKINHTEHSRLSRLPSRILLIDQKGKILMTTLGIFGQYRTELVTETATYLFGFDGTISTLPQNVVFNTTVGNGGSLIERGGTAFFTVVNANGFEQVDSGCVSIS